MRLTLRTMLAYLDEILEPEDAEEISKKIEESEFATSLMHRTRDVMRRLRLGTPDVADRGLGLDPNTVAEYLDNSLAPDRVLDFEKVCLESDVHLAEVACCHQILALVLGEPAEVDPASRQRMYQLSQLADAEATEPAEQPAAKSAAVSRQEGVEPGGRPTVPPPEAEPRVPGWLRDETLKRRGWWPTAAAAVVALACVVLVLAVTGQFERGSFLGDLLGFGPPDQAVVQAPDSAPAPHVSPQEPPGPAVGRPEAGLPEAGPPATAGQAARPDEPTAEPEAASQMERGMPREPSPAERPSGALPAPQPQAPSASVPGPGAIPEPGPEKVARVPSSPTTPPLAQPPVAETAEAVLDAEARAGAQPGGPPETQPGPEPGPPPVPSEVVGRFDAPMQVLLALEADTATWQRVPDQAPLMCETSYLSLPTYRPMLRLADETQVLLVDETQVELLPVDQQGVASLVVEFGRLVAEAPKAGTQLRLQVGERSGVITFGDAGSRLAVEVSRASTPGADPETQPGPLTANLYASSGKVLWQEQSGQEPVPVHAPVRLRLNDQPLEAVAVERFPNWIVADTISLLDKMASNTVERELEVGRAAALGLRELADHRRKEVRWLALRCLGTLGDFELMVAALDDPEQKTAWPDVVEQLRAAVVRSPQAAAQVRTDMEKLHGSEGASLYEMLWRYDDNALSSEDADRLVRDLDHDTLAFRVVAFQTLRETTKLGLYYQPEDTAQKRRPWVEKWRERLKSSTGPGAATQGGQPTPSQGEDPSAEGLVPEAND